MKLNLKKYIINFFRQFPLLISAAIIVVLLGSGIGVAILLRNFGWDMGAIAIPAFVIEGIFCYVVYQFASNFFPEEEKTEKETELPDRKIKK
ncbi:MAG: hypothetical protein ACTSVI_17220 [Promethearchaeota archaeon]